jgi:membrane-bound metal-dependent hydrolase YbcI (DUF457 family)
VGAAFLGSWLPDVDRLGARVHRRSRFERRSLAAAAAIGLVRLPAVVFALVARHRGLTHSLLGAALAGLVGALLLSPVGPTASLVAGAGIGLGYLAHVLADGLTPSGVALWAPLSRRPVRLLPPGLRIRTGSLREALFALATVALLAVLVGV